jgi:hypothetical protein
VDDWAGAEALSDPVGAAEPLDEAPDGGAEPWDGGGVKSAVMLSAGLGCVEFLAFSLKAAKVFSPSWGALIAKTIPLLQWLSWFRKW